VGDRGVAQRDGLRLGEAKLREEAFRVVRAPLRRARARARETPPPNKSLHRRGGARGGGRARARGARACQWPVGRAAAAETAEKPMREPGADSWSMSERRRRTCSAG